MKTMSKKVTINILFLVLAVFLTISTAFKKIEVFNQSELNNLSCGWPLHYISSSFEESRYNPPFPWKTNCVEGEWGDPVDVYWGLFIFDIAFFYLLIMVLYYYWKPNRKKIQVKKQDHIES